MGTVHVKPSPGARVLIRSTALEWWVIADHPVSIGLLLYL